MPVGSDPRTVQYRGQTPGICTKKKNGQEPESPWPLVRLRTVRYEKLTVQTNVKNRMMLFVAPVTLPKFVLIGRDE